MENEKSILALWKKTGTKGEYLSGSINLSDLIELANGQDRVQIIVFKNDRKTEDKYPDYRGYLKRAKVEKQETPPTDDSELSPF